MKECGHSFCIDCANACLPNCPYCRVTVTGLVPNFIGRELIGSLTVKCPNSRSNEDGSESNRRKRTRSNGNGRGISKNGCSWSREYKDLKAHTNECEYSIIECPVEGCKHECCRGDMIEFDEDES